MKDYRVYLVHILEAIIKIRKYTIQARNHFLGEDVTKNAVGKVRLNTLFILYQKGR